MSKTTAAVSSECTLLISDQNNGGLQLATNLQLYNQSCITSILLLHSQDAALLDDIRSSFGKDGLQWAMQPDKKMIHLWKKLTRTEAELRKTSIEVKNV